MHILSTACHGLTLRVRGTSPHSPMEPRVRPCSRALSRVPGRRTVGAAAGKGPATGDAHPHGSFHDLMRPARWLELLTPT